MFDINLLNNPGIQDNKSYNQNNTLNKIDRISKITNKDKKTEQPYQNVSWFAYLLTFFSIVFISFIIYFYGYHTINRSTENQLLSTENLFIFLSKNSSIIKKYNLGFNNKELQIHFNIYEKQLFYSMLNEITDIIGPQIKASHQQNIFSFDINIPWSIRENHNFTISSLEKELTDLDLNLKKEIYKNKLIMVTDISHIFKIILLMNELNIIDKFQINIEALSALPGDIDLYKFIIE